ncbi:MAG TPA: chromate resistance protein ChrB domain-containing protein [Gemmatimonadales bacterium]|jgi:hypothetical protein
MRWITRERPKIDRVACPRLIRRFIDPASVFFFAAPAEVERLARELDATPFDVEGVELSHEGPKCSFDAFLTRYQLDDPALRDLAVIVRGADTNRLDLAPQCAGLLAISLGLSHGCRDDQEMVRRGFLVYDALYDWLRYARDESHSWNPQRRM